MTEPLRIAVRLTGGLGDVLIASPMLEALHDVAGDAVITPHYHTVPVATFAFARAGFVAPARGHDVLARGASAGADILMHAGHFPRYIVHNPRRVNTLATPALKQAMAWSAERIAGVEGFVTAHPKLDGVYARLATRNGAKYLDAIGHMSGLPVNRASEIFLAPDPAHRWPALLPDRYITLHDGFDNRQAPLAGRATKCWPLEHWQALVRRLREICPDYELIQLGAGKSRPIPGIDRSLVNLTTLDQTAWIMKGAAAHVDTDSGLAHMAHALHTPAVVLFGPTNIDYYGHESNDNVNAGACLDCWHSVPDWLAKCPRGLAVPECMQAIAPAHVAERVWMQIPEPGRPLHWATLEASPVELYGGEPSRVFPMFCERLGLKPRPISEHITDPTSGLYVHASKQWEYLYAMTAIGTHFRDADPLRIADVGGGRGALAAYLASVGASVTQYDLNYQWAGGPADERRYRSWSLAHGYAARYGSIYNVPARTRSFDVVTCISVVEHLPDKPRALRELVRLVKPGGILILTFDFASAPDRYKDRFRVDVFGPESLERELQALGCRQYDTPSTSQITASADRIQHDGVAGIPVGMTVAGLTIKVS
jgi:ADP-heptose:LPS heptosyltransferase/SAM-dependent methyltransferase